MVWYPKEAFDAAGYTVPTTFAELIALSDQIVADGSNPWCVGFESGGATGWPRRTGWKTTCSARPDRTCTTSG